MQANSATLVRAGERAEFRIISRDQYGNVRSQGGDEFKVAVRMTEGPGKTEVQVCASRTFTIVHVLVPFSTFMSSSWLPVASCGMKRP